jgi:hypothetical protein
MLEYLPTKSEVLSSNLTTIERKKARRRERERERVREREREEGKKEGIFLLLFSLRAFMTPLRYSIWWKRSYESIKAGSQQSQGFHSAPLTSLLCSVMGTINFGT